MMPNKQKVEKNKQKVEKDTCMQCYLLLLLAHNPDEMAPLLSISKLTRTVDQ